MPEGHDANKAEISAGSVPGLVFALIAKHRWGPWGEPFLLGVSGVGLNCPNKAAVDLGNLLRALELFCCFDS